MIARERVWAAGRPVDVLATLGPLRRGSGDPAHHVDAQSTFWWACATPDGDGSIALRSGLHSGGDTVTATAWGPGAGWLLDRVPALLGADDDWSALDLSDQPRLQDVRRYRPGLRLPATGLVLDSLVPAVLEQRVTGKDARQAWRLLLHRFGTPAPGPAPGPAAGPAAAMRVPPPAAVLLDIPTWDW
ncbi:MAG: 3-methyladenine glycosylase, partial [Pseudonocardiales bacterium]|nr:3-methyladenine glycosylase [Pseudonocardiales bacterium]